MSKLHSELDFFNGCVRTTKHQIQWLCGILEHCSKVIRGRRTFSRRIIDILSDLPNGNPWITLSSEFKLDLDWWKTFAVSFNGVAAIIHCNFGQGPTVHTDSSFKGYGIIYGTSWFAGYFNSPELPCGYTSLEPSHGHWQNYNLDVMNINVLELFSSIAGNTVTGSHMG